MEDNRFDNQMKSALERIEPPFDPSTWDALARKMDALQNPVPVDAVDKAVARGLQHLEPAFQPAHWDKLAGQMQTIADRRRRIIASKVAEAVLFALLAWNFGGLLFGEKPSLPIAPAKPKYDGPVAENQSPRRARTNVAPGSSEADGFVANTLTNNDLTTQANFVFENGAAAPGQFPGDATAVFASEILNANGQILINVAAALAQASAGFAPFAMLPRTPMNLVENAAAQQPQFAAFTIHKKSEKQYYVSNYASVARNHVRTPYDQDFQKSGYAQWSNGYGGGLAVGTRRGKWGAEAGIVYASKKYAPRTTIAITGGNPVAGYQGIALSEVDLDVLAVPVQVNRQIARAGRTSVRARAGATANFAVQSAYRYREIEVPGTSGGTGINPLAKQVGRGVFEGGQVGKNAWLTADAGLRIEHRVNQVVTAFVEPVYSLAVAGRVGPKRAQFGGATVNAGVMASL